MTMLTCSCLKRGNRQRTIQMGEARIEKIWWGQLWSDCTWLCILLTLAKTWQMQARFHAEAGRKSCQSYKCIRNQGQCHLQQSQESRKRTQKCGKCMYDSFTKNVWIVSGACYIHRHCHSILRWGFPFPILGLILSLDVFDGGGGINQSWVLRAQCRGWCIVDERTIDEMAADNYGSKGNF